MADQSPAKPRVPPPPPLHGGPPDALSRYVNARSPLASTEKAGFGEAEEKLRAALPGDVDHPPVADIDWATSFFGSYGLPSDLIAQINELGKKYGTSNPNVFFQSAQNLLRGSDWFKGVFPGFDAGVRAGLFTDETGYRGYVNGLNNIYQQYLSRHVSGDETAAALAQGATPDLIGRQFQGDAIASVNAPEWQYLSGAFDDNGALTAAERTAFGREQAGIDTPLGQMVQKRVQQATARASALFRGTLVTPSLSVANGRLTAPSLGAGQTPDVAA